MNTGAVIGEFVVDDDCDILFMVLVSTDEVAVSKCKERIAIRHLHRPNKLGSRALGMFH